MSKKDFAKIHPEEIDWATIPPEEIDWENITFEQDQARMRFEIEQAKKMGETWYSPMPLVIPDDPPTEEDVEWVNNLLRRLGHEELCCPSSQGEQNNS